MFIVEISSTLAPTHTRPTDRHGDGGVWRARDAPMKLSWLSTLMAFVMARRSRRGATQSLRGILDRLAVCPPGHQAIFQFAPGIKFPRQHPSDNEQQHHDKQRNQRPAPAVVLVRVFAVAHARLRGRSMRRCLSSDLVAFQQQVRGR